MGLPRGETKDDAVNDLNIIQYGKRVQWRLKVIRIEISLESENLGLRRVWKLAKGQWRATGK